MKFCPECGHDFNEQGTCDCCGYPEVKEQPVNHAIGVFDNSGPKFGALDSTPRFGLLDSAELAKIVEQSKNKKFDPKTGEEITKESMLDTLEKLGFVSKEK